MARVEKTIFISYRRADISWALLVYKYLTNHDYDVFFDFTSISSGDFEQIIISNIKARAHFLIILTPTALDRCSQPGDWLRREIETAINEKRNIIPIFFDGFSFGNPLVEKALTGRLETIKRYNGLEVPSIYFDAAMERLRNQFLNVALDTVLHPISDEVQKVVEEQKNAAEEAISEKDDVEKMRLEAEQRAQEELQKRIEKEAREKVQREMKERLQKEAEENARREYDKKKVKTLPDRLTIGDIEFCRIPAGPFLMGSDGRKDKAAYDDEKPQHSVDIPYDYWMVRFPVTNEQYNFFVQSQGGSHPISGWKSKRDHPVVEVSWHDAMAYCRWLNDFLKGELPEGLILRLPTEAEWEKAARGTDGRIYPWGNNFDEDNCNTDEGGKGDTSPVGAYSPEGDSPFGCVDMSGNVWEWTHSLYKPYPYREDDGREDEEADDKYRVMRGGSWDFNMDSARVSARSILPSYLWFNLGFRVVVVSPPT